MIIWTLKQGFCLWEMPHKETETMEGISRLKSAGLQDKTFLAGCIANALMDRNIPVLMTSFPKLINSLGGLYRP